MIDLDKAYKHLLEIWDTKIDDKNIFEDDDEKFSYLYYVLTLVEKMFKEGTVVVCEHK